jgi:hypothetical protein
MLKINNKGFDNPLNVKRVLPLTNRKEKLK